MGLVTQSQPNKKNKGALNDPTLQRIANDIDAKVPKDIRKQYDAICNAGMKIMFDSRTNELLIKGLKNTPDVWKNVSVGISGLIANIYMQSGKRMSIPAAMPASIYLMCEMIDFAEKAGMLQVTPQKVAECTQATTTAVLDKFGINQDKINEAVKYGQSQAQRRG